VTGSQQNTTSGLPLSDDMTSSRCTQDAILANQQLLHTIRSTNLCNKLHNFWVPVSSITTNDKEAALSTFWNREEDGRDERLAVVGLLEDGDLFAKSGAVVRRKNESV
jgi:hypothetical protein